MNASTQGFPAEHCSKHHASSPGLYFIVQPTVYWKHSCSSLLTITFGPLSKSLKSLHLSIFPAFITSSSRTYCSLNNMPLSCHSNEIITSSMSGFSVGADQCMSLSSEDKPETLEFHSII